MVGTRITSSSLACVFSFAVALLVGAGILASSETACAGPTEKAQTLSRLRELRQGQIDQLEKINAQLRQRIAQSQSLTLQPINSGRRADIQVTEQSLRLFASTLETLRTSRAEAEAKRKLFDLLMFYIETRWSGTGSLRDLLHNASLDAAVNDATESSANQSAERDRGDLTRFFVFLSIALRDAYDMRSETPREVLAFIEDYVRFSSVLEPRLPSDFAQSRSYTNGLISTAAQPKHPVEAADEVERLLKGAGSNQSTKDSVSERAAGGQPMTRPTTAKTLEEPQEQTAEQEPPPVRVRWVPETPLEQILEELNRGGQSTER